MRYFTMTDDEKIVDLGECDDFNEAFEQRFNALRDVLAELAAV